MMGVSGGSYYCPHMLASPSFRLGLRDSILILLAVGSFGVAFGVLAVEAGLSVWLTVLASVLVVSGAAQFALVGLLALGPAPVLVATTGLALRHIPMSARLADLIGPQPLWTRLRLAWVLADETFGLTLRASATGVEDVVAYKTAADLMLYSGWVVGTAAGAVLGSAIDPERAGIGVLFPLMFLGLAAPLVRARRDWVIATVAVVAALVATLVLPSAWQVTIAATAAAVVGVSVRE
jgi:4-azaleucine resistance transporter AzlC